MALVEQVAVAPKTVSGKRATLALLVVLLLTGSLFYWVTVSYSQYNAARRQTERTWRELAAVLDARYRAVDAQLVQAAGHEPALVARWQTARTRFAGTTIYLNQLAAAQELEEMLDETPPGVESSVTNDPALEPLVVEYERAVAQQREEGATLGARLLKVMLNLPEPGQLHLHRP